jgi:hypothetical protein
MTELIEQVEELKAELKDKFLDYYQANQNWLKKMEGRGQTINNTWFILGVVTALEPRSELKELLQYFLMVSQDSDTIARDLGLNFDPEKELEKRQTELAAKETKTVTKYLDQIREEIKT